MNTSADGYFGPYGGSFVAETLVPALEELAEAVATTLPAEPFQSEYAAILRDYVGRPTPLYHAARWSSATGGAQLWLKREDLAHTGAHKINNTVGQALLARQLGKRRVIAETGAGQHGVATAAVAARLGLECTVYMGAADAARQAPNVERIRLMGAELRIVDEGARTLKDALNAALRDWVSTSRDTLYVIGSVAGPHPFPLLVRELQSVIGREAREQFAQAVGGPPDAVVACVGGGSNAIGIFSAFLDDERVELRGVEAGGHGIASGRHAAPIAAGGVGVLHGSRSYVMQDDDGQTLPTHSLSAGLEYPGVGPEHAWLHDQGRVRYVSATDEEAVRAFKTLSRLEGIIPALESAHALAHAEQLARERGSGNVLINLSGRGDKDLAIVSGEGHDDAD